MWAGRRPRNPSEICLHSRVSQRFLFINFGYLPSQQDCAPYKGHSSGNLNIPFLLDIVRLLLRFKMSTTSA